MEKNIKELRAQRRELSAKLADMAGNAEMANEFAKCERELKSLDAQINDMIQDEQVKNTFREAGKSKNTLFREYVQGVREHRVSSDMKMMRADSQNIISSGIVASGDLNNMETAGLPVTVKDLINPLEMATIYNQLGIQVATGVRGQIQWPVLDTVAKVSVAGETVALSTTPLDFSKIVAKPVRLGISIEVDNEAINDAGFDLVGCVTTQINKALGRVINEAVISTSKFNANFYGPLCNSKVQTVSFATAGAPTYKELLQMKGKVLAKGAQMAGFCYVMDAAMYSTLEATPIDNGSGLMIIQNGKINGAPVFVTDLTDYANKVGAGCFGYAALNQHGDVHFITDVYTLADKNATKFTLNADFSLTTLQGTPFVVGA